MGLSLLSVGTEVSDCACVCHLKFLGNHLMSRLYTSTAEFIYNSSPAFSFFNCADGSTKSVGKQKH